MATRDSDKFFDGASAIIFAPFELAAGQRPSVPAGTYQALKVEIVAAKRGESWAVERLPERALWMLNQLRPDQEGGE